MPSWRKVILSGSNAALNSLNVTTSITASVVSASQFTGSSAIINNLNVNNFGWTQTPNSVAWFAPPFGYIAGAGAVNIYTDDDIDLRPYSLRVGAIDPDFYQSSGSHILKDGRELFTNAKISADEEPFIILGFGGKNAIQLDTGIDYTHPGIDDYSVLLDPGSVVAGSLKLRKSLYGLQDDKGVQLFADGFAVRPQSPGFLIGQGGYYIFDSASMQFNISGALVSPVESASVKFTLGSDSSSLSLLVGKNDLREALFISRSGNEPRVGIGLTTPQNTLTVSGSLRVFTSITSSIVSASQIRSSTLTSSFANISQISATSITASNLTTSNLITSEISASNTVRLSGGVLELPNLTTGTSGNYTKLLIVDSVGRVRTLDTGSVPYIEVGPGVIPVEQKLVMFTGSTGDVANAIGVSFSTVTGWTFSNNNGVISDLYTDRFYSPSILGNNITGSIISASGGITGSNLSINGFPNVSASLASLASGVGTLQQVTDAGNTTTNPISSSFNGVGFFGTASWAINVVNGGGGGGGGSDSAFLNQSTAATTWSFAHNLGTQYPVITVYDTTGLVIIPQEIDGEDTNNLKIYFPTSQSGYATAVGGTSALTYYSQSLTTASVSLNTITFTKGDSSTFDITVNTGSVPTLQQVTTQGASTTIPITASIISASSFTGSLFGTASWAVSASFASTASFVRNAQSASYVLTAQTASYVLNAQSASYVLNAISSSFAFTASFVRNAISSSYLSGSNVIASYITASNGFRVSTGNLTIDSQIIYPQGSDGFSVNESFNVGNSTQTAYHFTSGDSARTSVVFSLARTSNFTNMFGITGSSTDNKFVIGAETSNTDFEWRTGLGVAPVKLQGGNLLARLDRSGSLYISRSVSASSFTGSLFGTASYALNGGVTQIIAGTNITLSPVGGTGAVTINAAGGGGGSTDTGSLLVTASATLNTITFTKGDSSQFSITINTGSGGGGSVGTLQQVTEQGASTTIPITASIISASSFTGSLFGTSSWAINALTASFILGYVQNSQTSSFVLNSQTSSMTVLSSSFALTSSLANRNILTASVNLNTITFTKGDSSTFNLTIDTGSGGGGGSTFPFTGSAIISGSLIVTGSTSIAGSLVASTNITASRTFLSSSNGTTNGSTLTVYGSGSAQPVFTVQGSSGELFSITDSLTGSLFSVNDISGLPILEVFSDNSVLIGSYLDPMLISTAKVTQTNSGSFTVYSLPTASYDTAFFEYSVKSGSNARAGIIMAIQNGASVNFTETTTTDFGSTSAISFTVVITGSNMALTGSSTTGAWTIKTIVRGI